MTTPSRPQPDPSQPTVTRKTITDADGNVVGNQETVQGHPGQKFIVFRARNKVMEKQFVMVSSTGARRLSELELTGLEAQLAFHLIGHMEFGNYVTLNVAEFCRQFKRSTGAAYPAVAALVAKELIQVVDAGAGRRSRYQLNPSWMWKGKDRRERAEAIRTWEYRSRPLPDIDEVDMTDEPTEHATNAA